MAVYLDLHRLLPFLDLSYVCYLLESLQHEVHKVSEVQKDIRILSSTELRSTGLNVLGECQKKTLLKSNPVCLTDEIIAKQTLKRISQRHITCQTPNKSSHLKFIIV